MRVLIINSNRERSPWPVPPVGACAVASGAEQAAHQVRFLDLCFVRRVEARVASEIEHFRPEIIGISVRNIDNVDWQAPRFYLGEVKRRVVDACKARASCPVAVGGPAASIMPREMLEYLDADFVICGDGEVAFVQLLEALSGRRSPADVAGLTYREGGSVRSNPPARVEDLDSLPMPQPHRWLDLRRYLAYNASLGIQTKRGCSLSCTYCVYNRIEGSCYRLKSPRRVAAEVDQAVNENHVPCVEFVDSTFNIPLPHALSICRMLIAGRFAARFSTMGINPGSATEELFGLLREANFTEASLTPETASPRILKSLGKNFTLDDLVRAARTSRKAHLPIVWYFMFGAPGENEETVAETLAFIDEHIPRTHLALMVSGIRIFKGSELEAQARREGQLKAQDDLLHPVWYRPEIQRQRLFALLDEAMLRRPNCIALQDNQVPQQLLRAASAIQRFLHSRRPLWEYMRHVRRLQSALGLPRHLLAGGRMSA